MKINKKIISLIFSLVFVCLLCIGNVNNDVSKNLNVKENNFKYTQKANDTTNMSASIYFNSECLEDSKELDLTPEGVYFDKAWEYEEAKFLLVNLEKLDKDKKYRLIIDLDQSLYVDIAALPDVSKNDYLEKIEFVKNEPIKYGKNNNLEYELKDFSGDFTYYIAKGVTEYSFSLQIRYDVVLWDKLDNVTINSYSEEQLLRVSLEEIVDESTKPITTTEVDSGKLLSIVTGKGIDGIPYTDLLIKGGGGASIENVLKLDYYKTAQISLFSGSNWDPNMYTLYEELNFYIDIPKANYNNEVYEMLLGEGSFIGYVDNKEQEWSIEIVDDKILVSIKNLKASSSGLGYVYLNFPESLKDVEEQVKFNSKVEIKIVNKGVEKTISTKNYEIILNNTVTPEVKPVGINSSSLNHYIDRDNTSVVQLMGGYGIQNTGADSGKIMVSYIFDTTNLNGIHVTTLRMHPDNVSDYIPVKYSLIDDDGNLIWFDSEGNVVPKGTEGATQYWYVDIKNTVKEDKGNSMIATWDNILFKREDLQVEEHKKYYFKSIEYILGKIESGTTMYQKSSPSSYTAVGNFWGYVNEGISYQIVYSDIYLSNVIEDENGSIRYEEIEGSRINPKTIITDILSCSYGISNAQIKDAETLNNYTALPIIAGDSFILSGTMHVVSYPYSGNNILNNHINNIRIAVLLPRGASVREDSIILRNKYGEEVFEVLSLTNYEVDNGNYIWIIDVKPDDGSNEAIIGYANEDLNVISSGELMEFQFQVDTSIKTSAVVLNLDKILFATANKLSNASAGTYTYYQVDDLYDLNNNNNFTDKISGLSNDYNDHKIDIQAYSASLSINATINEMNENVDDYELCIKNSYDEEGNMISDYIQYDFNVSCSLGGYAKDFVYYIPIVKTGSIIDEKLIFGNQVSLVLQEIPIVNNLLDDSGIKILYTTETDFDKLTYNALSDSEIEKNVISDIVWESDFTRCDLTEITMIKVVSMNEKIANGSESVVSLKIGIDPTVDREKDFSKSSTFSSHGYYVYNIGTRSMAGHFGINKITTSVGYVGKEITKVVTLNSSDAIKDGNTGIYSVYTEIEQDMFTDEYRKKFLVSSLNLHNVTLVKGLDPNCDIAYANSTFDVSVSKFQTISASGNKYRYYSLTSLFNNSYITISRTTLSPSLPVSVKISYVNKLTDNATSRYVTFNLISDDNAYIQPIKIEIKRILTSVNDAESSIVSGKVYSVFPEISNNISITSGSSYTAQFILNDFIYENYNSEELIFGNDLPVNATVTIIDNSSLNKYYYYKVDTPTDSILLTDFKQMGTNSNYEYNKNGGTVTRQILFIIDYPDEYHVGSVIETDITLLITSFKMVEDVVDTLNYKIVEEKTYDINSVQTAELEEKIYIDIDDSQNGYINYDYSDSELSLVLTPTMDSYIPGDLSIEYVGNRYYVNAEGNIIVPLNVVYSQRIEAITIEVYSNMMPITGLNFVENENLKLIPKLYLSKTFDGNKPMNGILLSSADEIFIKNSQEEDVALKVIEMSDIALDKDDLKGDITVLYEMLNCQNKKITVELQELDGYGYVINKSGISSINDNAARVDGVFDITQYSGEIKIKFGTGMSINKYKLVFNVYDKSTTESENILLYTYSYNFIVYE